ncbi:MAG: ABC transporter permease, partial [Pseudomonadota bacterium]
MTAVTEQEIPDEAAMDAARAARRARLFTRINKADGYFQVVGISFMTPILRAAAGDNPKAQLKELWRLLAVPVIAILVFLLAWGWLAPQVQTSLGAIPGPAQVWEQVGNLHDDHVREREKADAFYERQEVRNEKLAAAGKEDRIKWRDYTGKPTYYDQIWTSLQTVFFGFLLATVI